MPASDDGSTAATDPVWRVSDALRTTADDHRGPIKRAVPRLSESFIRCHEGLQHGRNEFDRIGRCGFTIGFRQNFGISNKITVNGGRQSDGDLDRLVVWKSRESSPTAGEFTTIRSSNRSGGKEI
ncbi:hypothetical protein ACVWY5_001093 [Bradyrhizobium sp. USDA 3256]